MKNKQTYRPKISPSYSKGGKNSYKDKEMRLGDKEKGKNYFQPDPLDFLDPVGTFLENLGIWSAIDEQQTYIQSELNALDLGTTVSEGFADWDLYGPGLDVQGLESYQDLKDFRDDIPGMLKPIESVSTEFGENLQDVQERRTGAAIAQMGKTGMPTGTKQILDSAATADIQTQKEVAGMKLEEEKMQQEQDKYLASLTAQVQGDLTQMEVGAEQTIFGAEADVFGDLTASYGDLYSSLLAADIALTGAETAAFGSMMGELLIGIGEILPGEKGMKVPKAAKGAKIQEYEEGAKQDMLPAEEAEVTPGEFSHETNPIDIVQGGEKIGEMTGGEGIIPPKDMSELEFLLSENDEEGVFEKMEYLITKWNQVTAEHEEKKSAKEAKGGAKMGYLPSANLNF